jgi:hypothetical protein
MNIKTSEVIQFLSLFIILLISSILFNKTGSQLGRFSIIIADALLYVAWGVWHHYSKDRFSKIIMLEYSLVSLLIIILAAMGLGIVRFL